MVFVTYEGVGRNGKRFRDTEVHTVREGKLRRMEFYFGWDVPQGPAPPPGLKSSSRTGYIKPASFWWRKASK